MNDATIQTVTRYFLTSLFTRLLTAAGAALVAHGLATDDQVQQQIPVLVQEGVGAALMLGMAAEAWWKARAKRQKELTLANTPSTEVTVKQ